MTTEEFSNSFDTLVSSYRRFKDFDKKEELDSIEFDEYEKSMFLTAAEEELVVSLYTGKNPYGTAFEHTEEMRRYLDDLLEEEEYTTIPQGTDGVSSSSLFFNLPTDLAFIVYEQVTFNDSSLGCMSGNIGNVLPVTHDEYNRIRRNPFRGPSTMKVLRLDAGKGTGTQNRVELISDYSIDRYMIRYLRYPNPIVLEDMPEGVSVKGESQKTECELNPLLHDTILRRAVQMALASKGISANS